MRVLKIDHSKPFNVNLFQQTADADVLGEVVVLEQDPRAAMLAEVDFSRVDFLTTAEENPDEEISSEEKLQRLRQGGFLLLDGHCLTALLKDYWDNRSDSILEWLRREREIDLIEFFGLSLNSGVGPGIPILEWNDDDWTIDLCCLNHVKSVVYDRYAAVLRA